MRRLALSFSVAAGVLVGCSAAEGDTIVTDPALGGTIWLAEDIEGQPAADGVRSTLAFEDERVLGSGGCNRFQGTATIDASELSFGPLASTRMMCPEPIMDQEVRFLQALGKARRFEIRDDGRLYLLAEGGESLLRFSRTDSGSKDGSEDESSPARAAPGQ